jgi:hypothetical protein
VTLHPTREAVIDELCDLNRKTLRVCGHKLPLSLDGFHALQNLTQLPQIQCRI